MPSSKPNYNDLERDGCGAVEVDADILTAESEGGTLCPISLDGLGYGVRGNVESYAND
jgi:hypothetical protein